MSDRYWDFRSCAWQGRAVEVVPEWVLAPVRADVLPVVPVQATSEQVEPVQSLTVPPGAVLA